MTEHPSPRRGDIKSKIPLNGGRYQLLINEKLAMRISMRTLVEYLTIGLESNSKSNARVFSTVLDRNLKALYDLDKKRVHVQHVDSILF